VIPSDHNSPYKRGISMEFWMPMRAGVDIAKQSVKLLCKNPVLLLYSLIMVLVGVGVHIYAPYSPQLVHYMLLGLSYAIGAFMGLCICRHAMHIVRQQEASVTESIKNIIARAQVVLPWIGFVVICILLSQTRHFTGYLL